MRNLISRLRKKDTMTRISLWVMVQTHTSRSSPVWPKCSSGCSSSPYHCSISTRPVDSTKIKNPNQSASSSLETTAALRRNVNNSALPLVTLIWSAPRAQCSTTQVTHKSVHSQTSLPLSPGATRRLLTCNWKKTSLQTAQRI